MFLACWELRGGVEVSTPGPWPLHAHACSVPLTDHLPGPGRGDVTAKAGIPQRVRDLGFQGSPGRCPSYVMTGAGRVASSSGPGVLEAPSFHPHPRRPLVSGSSLGPTTRFVSSSSKTNALNVSQKMIEMFVRTKHKIDKSHEFALVVVNDDMAWVRGVACVGVACVGGACCGRGQACTWLGLEGVC